MIEQINLLPEEFSGMTCHNGHGCRKKATNGVKAKVEYMTYMVAACDEHKDSVNDFIEYLEKYRPLNERMGD